jgi:hypothetical protein
MTPTAASGAVKKHEFAWIPPGSDSTGSLPMFDVAYDEFRRPLRVSPAIVNVLR